jgi:hypothetical protein
MIPDPVGGYYPPTAQHASREGKTLARNIVAITHHQPLKPFRFRTLGLLASIGQRTGVARILGFNFSGFIAWWLWRTIYLSKLPRVEKKLRVALDWTLDLFFSKDFVQYGHERAPHISTEDEPSTAQRCSTRVRQRVNHKLLRAVPLRKLTTKHAGPVRIVFNESAPLAAIRKAITEPVGHRY